MCNNVGLSLNGVNKGNACCARCAEFKPHLEKGATVGDTSKYNLCLALGSIYADGRCTGISSMKIEEKYRSKGWSGSAAPEVNANCPISIPESVSAAIGGGNVVVTSTQGLHMPDQKVPWSSEYRGMIDSGKGITMEQWLFGIPRAQSGAAQAGLIRGFTNSGFCRDSGIEAPSWPPKDLPKTAVPLTGKCGTAEVSEVFGSKAFVTRAGVLFFDPLDSDTVGFMRMHGSDSVYCQVPAQDAVEFATQVDGKAGDADFDQFVGPYAPKVLKNNRTRLQSARYGCSPLPNTSQIDVTAGQSDSVLGSLRRVDGPRGFNRISGVSARGNPSPLASFDFAPDSLGGYVFSGSCKDGSPAFRGLNNVNGIASQPGGISTGGSGSGQGTAGDAGGSSATGSSRPKDRSR